MPKPHKNEPAEDYTKRCIPQLILEGKPQDQAIAICHNMFDLEAGEIKPSKMGYDFNTIKNRVDLQLQAYGMVLNKNEVFIFTNQSNTPEAFQIARMCGIPLENIIQSNEDNKLMDINNLETYYSSNLDEVKIINEKTKCHAIFTQHETK